MVKSGIKIYVRLKPTKKSTGVRGHMSIDYTTTHYSHALLLMTICRTMKLENWRVEVLPFP